MPTFSQSGVRVIALTAVVCGSISTSVFFASPSFGAPISKVVAPVSKVVAIYGGRILLQFVGGFANKLGEAAAENLLAKYPPPQQGQRTYFSKNNPRSSMSYQLLGKKGNTPIYRVVSNDFSQLNGLDRYYDERIEEMNQNMNQMMQDLNESNRDFQAQVDDYNSRQLEEFNQTLRDIDDMLRY